MVSLVEGIRLHPSCPLPWEAHGVEREKADRVNRAEIISWAGSVCGYILPPCLDKRVEQGLMAD